MRPAETPDDCRFIARLPILPATSNSAPGPGPLAQSRTSDAPIGDRQPIVLRTLLRKYGTVAIAQSRVRLGYPNAKTGRIGGATNDAVVGTPRDNCTSGNGLGVACKAVCRDLGHIRNQTVRSLSWGRGRAARSDRSIMNRWAISADRLPSA